MLSIMMTRSAVGATIGVLVISTVLSGAPPAAAAPQWTVQVSGIAEGVRVPIALKSTGGRPQIRVSDRTAGWNFTCDTGGAHAAVKTGQQGPTQTITLYGPSFGLRNCVAAGGLPLIVTGANPWFFSAASFQAGSDRVSGAITDVAMHWQTSDGTTCAFDLAGQIPATYANATGVLAVGDGDPALVQANTQGCFGLLNDGDLWTYAFPGEPDRFTVTPSSGTGPVTIRPSV